MPDVPVRKERWHTRNIGCKRHIYQNHANITLLPALSPSTIPFRIPKTVTPSTGTQRIVRLLQSVHHGCVRVCERVTVFVLRPGAHAERVAAFFRWQNGVLI